MARRLSLVYSELRNECLQKNRNMLKIFLLHDEAEELIKKKVEIIHTYNLDSIIPRIIRIIETRCKGEDCIKRGRKIFMDLLGLYLRKYNTYEDRIKYLQYFYKQIVKLEQEGCVYAVPELFV